MPCPPSPPWNTERGRGSSSRHLASSPSCALRPDPTSSLYPVLPHSTQFPGLESRARRSTCATSPTAARLSVRRPCFGLTCACTPASGPLFATGSSVARGSHGATSSSGMPAPTQVCFPPLQRPPTHPHVSSPPATWRFLAWPRYCHTDRRVQTASPVQDYPGGSHKPCLFHSVAHNEVTCTAWP